MYINYVNVHGIIRFEYGIGTITHVPLIPSRHAHLMQLAGRIQVAYLGCNRPFVGDALGID